LTAIRSGTGRTRGEVFSRRRPRAPARRTGRGLLVSAPRPCTFTSTYRETTRVLVLQSHP